MGEHLANRYASNKQTRLGKPIHRRGTEATEKTQRKEGGRESTLFTSSLLLFFPYSDHLFSPYILCGLCASAVNWFSSRTLTSMEGFAIQYIVLYNETPEFIPQMPG